MMYPERITGSRWTTAAASATSRSSARGAGANASRYIRMFQSRRSLLVWKIFGERLDGWTNDDFPTETTPGDARTLGAEGEAR